MEIVFLFITGLVFGSFLAAYTWRIIHGISINKGRSFCDNCNTPISWYDNIPLVSYLLLGGKCRHCHKHISVRYPLIEASCGVLFVCIQGVYPVIVDNFIWLSSLGILGFIFFLFLGFLSLGIIVTDIEDMIIPDIFVFLMSGVSFFVVLFSSDDQMWMRLLVGFAGASFFMILNLITKGKGMGLGDVKLAIPFGFLLSSPLAFVWFFTSFVIGSLVGVFLLLSRLATRKSRIPFGPFMVIAFWLTLIWVRGLVQYIVPAF